MQALFGIPCLNDGFQNLRTIFPQPHVTPGKDLWAPMLACLTNHICNTWVQLSSQPLSIDIMFATFVTRL